MKFIPIIIIAVLLLSCGNGKGGKNNEPYDGGHGIGIDTATIHQIEMMEEKGRPPHEPDNMRGFDPASEDDMDDNGMSRYMENNDEEGWD